MKKPKYDWIIGINPVTKQVEILRNNPRDPFQGSHLKSVRTIHANKVSAQDKRDYIWALQKLYGLS